MMKFENTGPGTVGVNDNVSLHDAGPTTPKHVLESRCHGGGKGTAADVKSTECSADGSMVESGPTPRVAPEEYDTEWHGEVEHHPRLRRGSARSRPGGQLTKLQ